MPPSMPRRGHVYVAHTANDAIDVFDPAARRHLFSVPGLHRRGGCAGERREPARLLVQPRRADTIGVFAPGTESRQCASSPSACGPMAWPTTPDAGWCLPPMSAIRRCRIPIRCPWSISTTVRTADGDRRAAAARAGPSSIPRQTLFYVNIMQPSQIVVVDAAQARPDRPHHRRARRRRARPRLRSRDPPAVLRLRCRRAGHARCRHGQGSGRASPERRARRRVVQPQAPASLCRGRRSRRGRRLRDDVDGQARDYRDREGRPYHRPSPAGDWLFAFLPRTHRAASTRSRGRP